MSESDIQFEKLKLLFDYTKFHIGLYTGTVAALLGLVSLPGKLFGNFGGLYIYYLFVSVILICLAGLCGGVVASNIAESKDDIGFLDFWDKPIGFWKLTGPKTAIWSGLEHIFFWAGVFLALVNFATYFYYHQ